MGKKGELMLEEKFLTAIFSGKFMPFHTGHIISILKLAKKYGRVEVIILDFPDREVCSAEESKDILNSLLDLILPPIARHTINVHINDIHFSHISFAEYDSLLRNIGCCMNHSIYVSGNAEVLENMKTQGIKARYFARSDDYLYTGTKIREILAKTPHKFQPSFMELKDDRPF